MINKVYSKKNYGIITLITLCVASVGLFSIFQKAHNVPSFVPGKKHSSDISKPHILIVCVTDIVGGGEMHTLGLYTTLTQHKYPATLLVAQDSKFSRLLTDKKIPHYTTNAYSFRHSFCRPLYHQALKTALKHICATEKISIIQCNCTPEVPDALSMKKQFPVSVVFTRHCVFYPRNEHIRNVDALIAVNPEVANYLEQKNTIDALGIKKIIFAAPFFDAEPFINYASQQPAAEFFKEKFNIDTHDFPIITMVANFYANAGHKNHDLLLHAFSDLIHKKKKSALLMLAGDGPRKQELQKLTQKLNIEKYVHFLGFTKEIPGLLYHSDVMAHAAKMEAFGIVYMEAGLMKKPSIGATQTGAEAVIVNQKTGFLFKNNDVQELAYCIEQLIDNKEFRQTLGENAYNHIMKNFIPDVTFEKYEMIYQMLQKHN